MSLDARTSCLQDLFDVLGCGEKDIDSGCGYSSGGELSGGEQGSDDDPGDRSAKV